MTDHKKRLGRGLDSLLSSTRLQELDKVAHCEPAQPTPINTATREYVCELAIEKINRNPHQPRQTWDIGKLQELADSIRANGLVQPIIVRQMGQSFQLIAGERRLRAARLAGLEKITAIIRNVNEDQMLEWALIENIHRADLNAIERARAYQHYINNFCLTQQEAAGRLGEDRSTIANYLRLLELPDEIRDMINEGRLTMGHARALLSAKESARQIHLAHKILQEHLSVRQLERLMQQTQNLPTGRPTGAPDKTPHILEMEQEMTRALGTKVSIKTVGRKKHRGSIVIDFYSLDDFDRLREHLVSQGRVAI